MNRSPTDIGMVEINPSFGASDRYYHEYWSECWYCDGVGYMDECECESVVDQCFCESPTPRRCPECRGNGGWDTPPEDE